MVFSVHKKTYCAVHIDIETVLFIDPGSCVIGIDSFIARRSTLKALWSDNSTNFIGAEKELILCVAIWNRQAPTLLVYEDIEWKYNTPGAPHHDGSWGRLVRSCKHVFYAIIGTRKLKDDVFSTTFCLGSIH